tara:strand:- start:149 stop:1249 length:1101 start_codon:yes stop_codon:yes gene_type:complete
MDDTDPDIKFNDEGICNHCLNYKNIIYPIYKKNKQSGIQEIIKRIKRYNKNRNKYDCILGLSGGADSSYLLKVIVENNINPLCVHVDAGWNSSTAVNNIISLVKILNVDLVTTIIDWNEMRDLQLALMESGIPNQDVAQDHAFFANLYSIAKKFKIRTILNGGNIATESVFPKNWHYTAMDGVNINAIFKRFKKRPLNKFKTMSLMKYYFYYPYVCGQNVIRPLNYIEYKKQLAIKELKTLGWQPYGNKHGESRFTRYFQDFYLPKKFGLDKRKPHLSSLILSNQISRSEAINILKQPLYDNKIELKLDRSFVADKLEISEKTLSELENLPNKSALDYRNDKYVLRLIEKIKKINKIIKIPVKKYS